MTSPCYLGPRYEEIVDIFLVIIGLIWWVISILGLFLKARSRVGISGTTAKSRKRKFVPSSHPGPFGLVASSQKSQTKVGTLACFDFLYQNELTM